MVRNLPPLTAIRAFEAAARHESYVKASKELHVTATAISQQVSQLEEYLDVKLFIRMANRLRLTSAGRTLLPELTSGLEKIANATKAVRSECLQGTVRIGLLPAMAANWLVPQLSNFTTDFPNIHLSLHTTTNLERLDEEVDIKIRYIDGQDSSEYCQFLMNEEVFPVCSPKLLEKSSIRSLTDIGQFPLIHDIDGLRSQPWLGWSDWLDDIDINTHPGFEFRDSLTAMQATLHGLGVALGRNVFVDHLLSTGQLVAPLQQRKKSRYAYHIEIDQQRINNEEVHAVVDWLTQLAI